MATINTSNYTIGQVELFFNASVAHASLLAPGPNEDPGKGGGFRTTANSLGNIVTSEINPEITYIDHFVSDRGMRKKDKVAAHLVSLTIPFTFDEMSVDNLKRFFMASALSATRLGVFEKALKQGSAQLKFDTDVGNDMVYFIPKCTIRPNGALAINDESWWSGPMVLEVLYYGTSHWASKPYGFIIASPIPHLPSMD